MRTAARECRPDLKQNEYGPDGAYSGTRWPTSLETPGGAGKVHARSRRPAVTHGEGSYPRRPDDGGHGRIARIKTSGQPLCGSS